MSAAEDAASARGPSARPVGLECMYDDSENPSELTLYEPESESPATEWLTVDAATAVTLDEMR